MNTRTIDTERIKSNIDLRELAATYTTLHRESATEQAGPCPKCGGSDRFRVTATWWFCRQCHPKRSDAIEFMQWQQGVTFKEAAAMLTGEAMPAPATVRKPEAKHQQVQEWNEEQAARKLAEYQSALWDDANVGAHEYLEQRRGLDPHTWLLYGLGYRHETPLPNTWDAPTRSYSHPPQPAIAIPWYYKGRLVAIRYRFLQAHIYTDKDGKEQRGHKDKGVKQTAEPASKFSGHVFSSHAMKLYGTGSPEARTLVICEGEINCMSIWQVARDTKLDVLSLGSEGQKLTPDVVAHAQRYRLVLLWADREDIVSGLQTAVPGAFAVTSEMCEGRDANDLLQAGHLGGYLSAWRFQAAKDTAARSALHDDLQSGAATLLGIDAGSRQVMETIGKALTTA